MLELMLSGKIYDAKLSTQWYLNCVESMCIGKSLERNIPNVNSDFLGK